MEKEREAAESTTQMVQTSLEVSTCNPKPTSNVDSHSVIKARLEAEKTHAHELEKELIVERKRVLKFQELLEAEQKNPNPNPHPHPHPNAKPNWRPNRRT